MSFIEEEKSSLEKLRSKLKESQKAARSQEELEAASFLLSVVRDLLKRNSLQRSWNVLHDRLNNGSELVKALSEAMSKKEYKQQLEELLSIEDNLKSHAQRVFASLRALEIDPPAVVLKLFQVDAVPAEFSKTDSSASVKAVASELQPSIGASSTEGTAQLKSKKPYRYDPLNPANETVATTLRTIGADATWHKVVAHIDVHFKAAIPRMISGYPEPLPGEHRPTLMDIITNKKAGSERKRLLKIIREVREAIKRELEALK